MTERSDTFRFVQRTQKWTRRSAERPAELIAAGLACFSQRGFAATRLEDVAAAAGVSKATVYLYFDSKEGLFEAIARATIAPRLAEAQVLVESFDGTTPELVRALLALFEAALEGPFPAIAKLVIAECGNFPELARLWAGLAIGPGIALLQRIVARGVARREFRPVSPAAAAPLILAPVVLLGLWKESIGRHSDVVFDRRAILTEHAETLLRGLATPGAPRRQAPRRRPPRKGGR